MTSWHFPSFRWVFVCRCAVYRGMRTQQSRKPQAALRVSEERVRARRPSATLVVRPSLEVMQAIQAGRARLNSIVLSHVPHLATWPASLVPFNSGKVVVPVLRGLGFILLCRCAHICISRVGPPGRLEPGCLQGWPAWRLECRVSDTRKVRVSAQSQHGGW